MMVVVGQATTGAVVSRTVTVCVQKLVLPQPSVMRQVRLATFGQLPFVEEAVTTMLRLLLQQDEATGVSKFHRLPQSTILFVEQATTMPPAQFVSSARKPVQIDRKA